MKLKKSQPIDQDVFSNPDSMSFEQWARMKYQETEKVLNFCDADGNVNPQRLNEVLLTFSQSFTWAITLQEIESNKLERMKLDYDNWYKSQYSAAYRAIKEENLGQARAPGQETVHSRVIEMCGAQVKEKREAIENQTSRVNTLKGFVKVLEKQANILQTLSSNMRSELFFSNGVSLVGKGSELDKSKASKAVLRNAMNRQD